MFKVFIVLATLSLLSSTAAAVNIRGLSADPSVAKVATKGINASAFSPAFVAAVDAAILPIAKTAAFINANSSSGAVSLGGFMGLATRGAAELMRSEKAMGAIAPPPSVMKLLRHGHKAAGRANMWKSDVDVKMVEKAIINLNGMVYEAQKRLDAKNDECEEFKARYTETLDQIEGDLARLGEELSNTARAILVHIGGIDANILNNQQTKEELAREEIAYSEVRSADLLLLQQHQASLAISAFILDFSACPDAPAASASAMLLSTQNRSRHVADTYVKTCKDHSTGRKKLHFGNNPKLHSAAQRLSVEAEDVLLRFVDHEQKKSKFGRKIAEAASGLEAAALSGVQDMTQSLDDGDVEEDGDDDADGDDADDTRSRDDADDDADEEDGQVSLFEKKKHKKKHKKQDPCGITVDRIAIPDGKPCSKMPASCCSCNKYWTTVGKHGNDENGQCVYVPERRKCQSAKWVKRHPAVVAAPVCGTIEDDYYDEVAVEEVKAATRCSNVKMDCGVLHDMFAALWGETKDQVDELTWKMNQDTLAWDKVKADINSLLQTQATQLSNLQAALAEASAQKAAQTDEQTAKQKEKVDTTSLFETTMKECQDAMKEILFTEICGVLAVRNNMIAKHMPGETTPTDCGVGEWIMSDCSVSCDDELQGGTHSLSREVITMNTPRGVACPTLTTMRKCKQIPCPIECQLSSWSAWSKCSKECGGGVQSQTRSLEVKPKNGGGACDALTQTQPCNSGSCDKDCELGHWMDFKPCTKACGAGYSERRKRVLAEAQGEGFCLPWNDKERLERKPCNTQACMGDETCNSTIDLVIAVDSSGSMTEVGFDILKTFASRIVRRLMAPVQVGVVLFGNGKLDMKTNVISDAKVITDNLEGDMEAVAAKVDKMIIHKGFTNMAQAFTKAKDVLTYARKASQSTVLVLTDGRPSFKFQTGFAVKALRKSSRLMIVHVQAHKKKELALLLKSYVSEPATVNYRYIGGKHKLASAYESYVTSVLADLCPKLISPSALQECTVLDGSEASKVYPCECAAALCKEGQLCFADDQYCVDPELALVQSRRNRSAAA